MPTSRRGQRRRIVDAVADHRHGPAALPERGDDAGLVGGQHLRLDSRRCRPRPPLPLALPRVVAGQHDGLDAHVRAGARTAARADGLTVSPKASSPASVRRPAAPPPARIPCGRLPRARSPPRPAPPVAAPISCIRRRLPRWTVTPSTSARTPRPGSACASVAACKADAAACGPPSPPPSPADGRCTAGPPRPAPATSLGCAARGFHRDDRRPALGQRAGLVEGDDVDRVRRFQRFRILDQDAVAGRDAGAGHDGGRRRQAQRARAGDHLHRHRIEQRLLPVAGQQAPGQQRRRRDQQHHRHEHRADLVDQALDRRLDRLRVFHQPDDLRQHGLAADRGGFQHQHAVAH